MEFTVAQLKMMLVGVPDDHNIVIKVRGKLWDIGYIDKDTTNPLTTIVCGEPWDTGE